MTGQSWGRTGRVTLNALNPGFLTEVFADDERVGHVYDNELYAWALRPHRFSTRLPTFDHCVMWVLRRAALDVWRAERPVILQVRWRPEEDHDRPWVVTDPAMPGTEIRFSRAGTPVTSADRWARSEYRRLVERIEHARAAR